MDPKVERYDLPINGPFGRNKDIPYPTHTHKDCPQAPPHQNSRQNKTTCRVPPFFGHIIAITSTTFL